MEGGDGPAARRWAEQLAAWAIPEEILAAAPESPWHFPTTIFASPDPEAADSPSRRRAREALPEGGTVLDVGVGGGAAGLGLVPPAGRLVGVDESAELLASFAARASERGIASEQVQGRWPDVAGSVGSADVVVCHHVFYNVPDLAAFATALTDHARRRVVVELTGVHPVVSTNPLWRHFHGLERPEGPSAADAAAVLAEAAGPAPGRRAAQGWGGDRYVVWSAGGRTCIRWNLVMDTPADTAELVSALRAFTARHRTARVESTEPVVVLTNCA